MAKTQPSVAPAIITATYWLDFSEADLGAAAAKWRFVPHSTSSSAAQRMSVVASNSSATCIGEKDVCPAEGRGVRQKIGRDRELRTLALRDGLAQTGCVPVDDDRGEEVERSDAEVLTFGRSVADFALSADPQRVLQRMMRLTLVEADLYPALHVGVQDPFDHKQRALDAADLPQGDGQVVLAGIGGQLPQDLAGRDGPSHHCRRDPQDVGPVGRDQVLPDCTARQTAQVRRHGLRLENVETLGRQVADAWDGPVTED